MTVVDVVKDTEALTLTLTAEFAAAPGRTAYLTLSRGYKAGGFNIGPLVPDERRLFEPEFLRSAELGLRLQRPDGGASLDAALFFMRRSALQVATSAQLDPGELEGAPHHLRHVDGQDALAQVAQLDHQDHPVAPARRERCGGERDEHVDLRVAAHVGGGRHAVHLAEQR